MNLSGTAIKEFIKQYNLDDFKPDNLIVIHDDLDLPLGKIKIKYNSGDGGHKGIRSIIETFNSKKFYRFKIGIGKPNNQQIENYVLSSFSKNETKDMNLLIKKVVNSIIIFAMTTDFNILQSSF